jgi:signal transduction histidine kinase
MKIKTKLIISFCIIMFVPILLSVAAVWSFGRMELRAIRQNYGISDVGTLNLTNSVQLLDQYTMQEFEQLQELAENSPEQFANVGCLNGINEVLLTKDSYLVVRREQEIVFNGGTDNEAVVQDFPDYGMTDAESSIGTFVDSSKQVMIKQLDFTFADGQPGSAFIVTSTRGVVPEVKKLVFEVLVAVVLILIFTAAILIVWIYRSMITPIRQLQTAAENIKEGNLDFTVNVNGEDEIGELGASFEAMRLRLKDNAEEKLSDEKENRALISNIAHDLKTPITAVKGYAEGIIDGVANTPEKVERYVRTIYNKANEMDTLINELTLYSQIDTNRIPYNFAKINVEEYFQDCIEEIGLDLEAKGIGLAYYNYVDSDVIIIADPEQLRRVINNIISNSIKYMNKTKGFINIRIKDVGDFIQVEMEDNGRGIAQRDLPYIFDRFYRTDASRNSATGGSGIGLSIVKKIVEDHGGKIWATSKEDTGTTMYFVIRKYEEVYNE